MSMQTQNQFTVTQELYATFGQRFTNWLVDAVAQIVIMFIALLIITAIAQNNGNKTIITYLLLNPIGQYTFVTCIRLVYYNVFEVFFARTVGKWVSNTIVVDVNGNQPDHQTILVRTLCRLIPFYELSMLGIPTRGWHDSISKTYVVNKKMMDEKKHLFYAMSQTANED
jgi:uncharacterized RDD family membrane protein YckC